MANPNNLKQLSSEEARKNGKKGGIKSGEKRRERKALKEELLLLLSVGDTQKKLSLALIEKAMNGDVKAFEVIRDTIGEKPTDKQEITGDIKTTNPVINILPVRADQGVIYGKEKDVRKQS